MESKIKKIGVMTSGGDAPGMNAATRSVVRKAVYEGMQVVGILKGFEGLINGEIIEMNSRSVSNILSHGGTILKTARSKEFMTAEGQAKAVKTIKKHKIDALVINGGNGSLQGGLALHRDWGIRNIGIPGTIDNDLGHTDFTIGAHTAVDTVLDAVDKIRDTVSSMERIYVVEVMGRKEPYLAVMSGLAAGAEEVLYPGNELDLARIISEIKEAKEKGKNSWIIIVSEGVTNAYFLAEKIEAATGFEARGITLGHIQRGGSPSAPDRILASRMGARAVEALIEGHSGKMVGISGGSLHLVSYEKACFDREKDRQLHSELYALTKLLAT